MGDVSPVYLVDISVAARIAAVRPDARIIVLLRDPVDRAFSQYLHHLRDGLEPCSTFEAALKQETVRLKEGWSWGHGYATHSHYEAQIDAYLSAFPYDQILFLDFAHLQAEPGDSWRQICTHLNIQQKPLLQNEYVNVTATLTSVSDRPAIKRALRHPGRIQRLLKPLVPSHARKHLRKMLEGNGTPVPELQDTTRKALAQRFQLERISIEQQTGLSLGHWTRAS